MKLNAFGWAVLAIVAGATVKARKPDSQHSFNRHFIAENDSDIEKSVMPLQMKPESGKFDSSIDIPHEDSSLQGHEISSLKEQEQTEGNESSIWNQGLKTDHFSDDEWKELCEDVVTYLGDGQSISKEKFNGIVYLRAMRNFPKH
jgi:hypothetical protein